VATVHLNALDHAARWVVAFVLATAGFAASSLYDSLPAQADWFEYGISGAPMCPGTTNGCPTLETSCQSAAFQYWGSNWPGKVISVRMQDYRTAICEILLVGSWPIGPYGSTLVPTNSTCPGTQMAWSDTGCVPYTTNPKKDCGADCDPGTRNGPGANNLI